MEIITRSFQQITDTKAGREGFEEDDDVFYAELKRQILLLTEDDEEEEEDCPVTRKRKEPINRLTNKLISSAMQPQPGSHFDSWGGTSVPSWLVHVWRTSNGTGVFIPQVVKKCKTCWQREYEQSEKKSVQASAEKATMRLFTLPKCSTSRNVCAYEK